MPLALPSWLPVLQCLGSPREGPSGGQLPKCTTAASCTCSVSFSLSLTVALPSEVFLSEGMRGCSTSPETAAGMPWILAWRIWTFLCSDKKGCLPVALTAAVITCMKEDKQGSGQHLGQPLTLRETKDKQVKCKENDGKGNTLWSWRPVFGSAAQTKMALHSATLACMKEGTSVKEYLRILFMK
ncbi:hypothetical protein EK904_013848 [Melospiza melodia maxima]|nr:hypothetical protein EK904_013848 [Melospiza melodia maxima]